MKKHTHDLIVGLGVAAATAREAAQAKFETLERFLQSDECTNWASKGAIEVLTGQLDRDRAEHDFFDKAATLIVDVLEQVVTEVELAAPTPTP